MRVHVEFDVEIEEGFTDMQIEEWLRFELKDDSSIQIANPLSNKELEPLPGTFYWRET
jgi:hypothetical protein